MTQCATKTFAFISDSYTINFTDTLFETKKKNWIMESKFEYGNRYFHLAYLNCWPFKMSVSPSFQIARQLNSKNQYMKLRFRMNS